MADPQANIIDLCAGVDPLVAAHAFVSLAAGVVAGGTVK